MKFFTYKKLFFLLIFSVLTFIAYRNFFPKIRSFDPEQNSFKLITLKEDGLAYSLSTQTRTVAKFLEENQIILGEFDQIIPEKGAPLFSGSQIEIHRALKVNFAVDGKNIPGYALARNIRAVISENHITLGRLDQTIPDLASLPTDNLKIVITRINVEEKIIPEEINFKTIEKNDPKLSWREKKVEQKGVRGIKEVKYKITYRNNKEISRIILEKNITLEPVSEIAIQGTYMQLSKAKRGEASRYAQSWGNLNASRDIPRGGYAKVTNMDNGKSAVVRINDYGPQSPSRVIDLSYEAFSKIAHPGQGIIHSVKVEQILN